MSSVGLEGTLLVQRSAGGPSAPRRGSNRSGGWPASPSGRVRRSAEARSWPALRCSLHCLGDQLTCAAELACRASWRRRVTTSGIPQHYRWRKGYGYVCALPQFGPQRRAEPAARGCRPPPAGSVAVRSVLRANVEKSQVRLSKSRLSRSRSCSTIPVSRSNSSSVSSIWRIVKTISEPAG